MNRQSTKERQKQIKKAVLDIIAAEGLSKLSTRNLAAKVGLSEGALFRHFRTKKEIISSIMQDVHDELIETLRSIASDRRPAKERLADFLCAHINYLIDRNGITILLFSEAAHMNDPELKSSLHSILIMQKQLVSKILQDGIVEGVWDEKLRVENIAMLYMGIPISLNIELVLNPDGVNVDRFCKRMMVLLARVLEKR